MDTIVTLFAHPDDETNAMGGTLWLLKDRYRIILLCLTRGERGLSPGYAEVRRATGQIREAELQAVAQRLGAEVRFLDRIDGEVYADREICERVSGILQEVRPVAFFGMWPIDNHPDHAAASEIARKAMRLSGYAGEFWMIEESLGQTAHFEPDLCVDISGVQEEKDRLIRCHACQNADDAMVREMAAISRFRGAKAGCKAAEGFKSLRSRRSSQRSILEQIEAAPPT